MKIHLGSYKTFHMQFLTIYHKILRFKTLGQLKRKKSEPKTHQKFKGFYKFRILNLNTLHFCVQEDLKL